MDHNFDNHPYDKNEVKSSEVSGIPGLGRLWVACPQNDRVKGLGFRV